MSQPDFNFYKPFIWVLGSLLVFTFVIITLANMVSPAVDRTSDPLVVERIQKQIAPVGQSRVEPAKEVVAPVAAVSDVAVEDVAVPVTAETEAAVEPTEAVVADTAVVVAPPATDATAAALVAEIPLNVRAVVATNCAGCHQEGVKGAQRTDDTAAWSALAATGLDALTASVIQGKGAMMPRAETTLSDEEIGLAVQHMIAQSLGDSSGEVVPVVTDQNAQSDAEPAAEAEPVAVVEKPAEAVVVAEIPANVKAAADTVCASCHISGVANAPKYGDKAAWDERMALGIDTLVASVIAGKGVMPARGGSQLSDAEIKLAIEYMASK